MPCYAMTVHHCSICNRLLDREDGPLSPDCGGDCYGCIIVAEDGAPAPDLPVKELYAWIEARGERERALGEDVIRRAT